MFSKSEKDISELVSRLIEVYFRFPGGVAKRWGKFGIVVLWWKVEDVWIGRMKRRPISSLLYKVSEIWYRFRPYRPAKSTHEMLHVICLRLSVFLINKKKF